MDLALGILVVLAVMEVLLGLAMMALVTLTSGRRACHWADKVSVPAVPCPATPR